MSTRQSIDNKYLQYLIETPGESEKADYKSAVLFDKDTEYALKLAKHILGFANNNGGYIFIGFNDKDLTADSNLSNDIVESYDTTRLAQFVNSCTSNQEKVLLMVSKIPNRAGRIFPIISIQPFKRYPFFCSDKARKKGYSKVFKEGSIYFRDEEAKTVEVVNEFQFRAIIDRCVRSRQDEMLVEFKYLIEKATGRFLSQTTVEQLATPDTWLKEARLRAIKGLKDEKN